jgi:hypothetical protein
MRAMTMMVTVCLALGGCATQSVGWIRADGKVATPEQRQLAMTICQGEMDKAYLTKQRGLFAPHELNGVYAGCMAQQGFVALNLR